MQIHVVIGTIGGYAREDAHEASLYGGYHDRKLADQVCILSGPGTKVFSLNLDEVSPGAAQAATQLGLSLDGGDPGADPRRLYLVAGTIGGYAREDADEPTVYGVYSDPEVARKVKLCCSATRVFEFTPDEISPGLVQTASQMGFNLSVPTTNQAAYRPKP